MLRIRVVPFRHGTHRSMIKTVQQVGDVLPQTILQGDTHMGYRIDNDGIFVVHSYYESGGNDDENNAQQHSVLCIHGPYH